MPLFEVTIHIENNETSAEKGAEKAKKTIEALGLKVYECKRVKMFRTPTQNRALHLLFTQLANELNAKGLDMRHLISEEVEIQWTWYTVKEHLWKPLQKVLLGKVSTTELDKTNDIDRIYDTLNKILIDRTKGEVSLPPFPSIDL